VVITPFSFIQLSWW